MCSETAAAEVVYEEVTVTSLAGVQPGDKPERFEAMENASTQKFKKERAAHYNEFEAMQVRGNAIANTSRHLALEVDMGWGGRSTNGSWRQASSATTTDAGGGGGLRGCWFGDSERGGWVQCGCDTTGKHEESSSRNGHSGCGAGEGSHTFSIAHVRVCEKTFLLSSVNQQLF